MFQGLGCCSEYPVSFHYVKPGTMYEYEYLFYLAKVNRNEHNVPLVFGNYNQDVPDVFNKTKAAAYT